MDYTPSLVRPRWPTRVEIKRRAVLRRTARTGANAQVVEGGGVARARAWCMSGGRRSGDA
jgi:hypothetical protein